MRVHGPVVAGRFYPAQAPVLESMISGLSDGAPKLAVAQPKALILPHAGLRYSGAVAAAGVSVLGPGIKRIVILGPSHRHAFTGVALPDADAVATPMGAFPLDRDICNRLLEEPDINVVAEAFSAEHSIEVELPFLQHKVGLCPVIPLVVGACARERLAQIINLLWGGPETLIVISTDLTHFLGAAEAQQTDLQTARAIEMIRARDLTGHHACGHRALGAFLDCAAPRGLRLTRLALTHSGVVTGDSDRVVGYGAWMAHSQETAMLSPGHRRTALRIARETLISRAKRGKPPVINLDSFPMPLQSVAAAFVTLTKDDRLRGCIGSLAAHRALAEDIMANTLKAGFEDPRFSAVETGEIGALVIEIAILSPPTPLRFADKTALLRQLEPGKDGLILQSGSKRGTFLPKVWEALDTPETFLMGLKVKAGLAKDYWSDDLKIWRYRSEAFTDKELTP